MKMPEKTTYEKRRKIEFPALTALGFQLLPTEPDDAAILEGEKMMKISDKVK